MKRILILFVILLFCLTSCKKSNELAHSVTDRTTVSEYSPMVLSVKEEFFVRFAKNYISEEEINSEVAGDLISVEPNTEGKAYWQDRRTIVYVPENQWEHHTNYKVFVDTDKMFNSGKRSMISFKTSALTGNVSAGPMQLASANDKSSVIVRGKVSMSDYVDPQVVEKALQVSQKNNDALRIEWQHRTGNFNHDFTIMNVKRFDENSEVQISLEAIKPMDESVESQKNVFIPTKGVFSFIDAKVPQGSAKYIEVAFSDPVDSKQNLEGLIRIKDAKSSYKYDFDRNIIKVYPTPFPTKNVSIIISDNIKSSDGVKLAKEFTSNIEIVPEKPQVRFTSTGNILPNVGSSVLAFETKALNAVDVEIFKIYENNMQEFFQSFLINNPRSYRSIGDIVHTEKMDLNNMGVESEEDGWTRYALSLDYFTDADPAAIYEVRLGFKQEYSDYSSCSGEAIDQELISFDPASDMFTRYYSYPDQEWNHYEDPCYPAYYTSQNFVRKNVLVSNLGLVAKAVEGKGMNIYASDLRTAKPISGATVNLYTQAKQMVTSLKTDQNGMAYLEEADDVFFIIGKNQREYSYITILNNRRLKTSQFEVNGVHNKEGLNAFLYGERGVWRPGDSIFLSLMIEDKEQVLPQDYPVKLNVFNSRGVLHSTTTKLDHVDGLYAFPIETSLDDPTGNWRAEAKVGNQTFMKQLKVETIKPNRLKINHDLANEDLYDLKNDKVKISSKWLHGTPSSGLKAKVEANLVAVQPTFEGYEKYVFEDPAREINTTNLVVFDGALNEDGEASFRFEMDEVERFPGNVKANLNTRVYEKSGNYSTYYSSNVLHPFTSYAGVKLPESRWGGKHISTTNGDEIEFVNVDTQGKPKANRRLKVGIYESRWSWWYNRSDRNIYKYNSDNHYGALDTFSVVTNAQGVASYKAEFADDYGNYLIRVCDEVSGHCTGEFFYTGSWGGSTDEENTMTKLNVSKNAESYRVGDEVKVTFPSSENANILITLESSDGVLQSEWIPSQGDQTEYRFRATQDMLPNIYVNVNMIQTWERENDLPIRMYGIIPIEINDPSTELKPMIDCADVFAPNSKVKVSVSEKDGKSMAYSIAMVDEGLLDLTNFKTPKPHNHFYAKQALTVRTWDMYDDVMNPNGNELEKIISVGGDGENVEGGSKKNANRFVPVVHFEGPHLLKSGERNTHEIEIPNYMGSVKIMVIAKSGDGYGNEHKVIPVKKELMLLSTFPRVLTLGDQFSIPVNTFWTEDYATNVNLKMETNEKVTSVKNETSSRFEKAGDKISSLEAAAGESEGIATFRITGEAGKFSSFEEIEIDVRNPNPIENRIKDFALQPGEEISEVVKRFGVPGNQAASLEVSRLPSLNLEKRLNYLIRYPYGCLEQTVSSVFPQLFLEDLTELSEIKKSEVDRNIIVAIKKLRSYQRSGRFNYWRGGSYYHGWSDIYAAHFLFEAEQKGYFIGGNILKNWVESHNNLASQFENKNARARDFDVQAYRLYLLALTGNANTGAMNRMRDNKNMSDRARYLLAAAYGRIGQASVGTRILENASKDLSNMEYDYYSFSSSIRDQSIAALTLSELDESGNALVLLNQIAEQLRSGDWLSTHSISFSLLVISKIANVSETKKMDYQLAINQGGLQSKESESVIDMYDLALVDQSNFTIKNQGQGVIYVSVINSGKEAPSEIAPRNDHLNMTVSYVDENGESIDYKNLKQGTDFKAVVRISNPGTATNRIEDLALTQIFPAGWEIRTGGLSNESRDENFQFQEVRDDRVNTFFGIYNRSVTFEIKLTAAYAGDYYLPPTSCESMYNNRIVANTASHRVKVQSK